MGIGEFSWPTAARGAAVTSEPEVENVSTSPGT
jgi:hypothetical protein